MKLKSQGKKRERLGSSFFYHLSSSIIIIIYFKKRGTSLSRGCGIGFSFFFLPLAYFLIFPFPLSGRKKNLQSILHVGVRVLLSFFSFLLFVPPFLLSLSPFYTVWFLFYSLVSLVGRNGLFFYFCRKQLYTPCAKHFAAQRSWGRDKMQ